MTDATKVTCPTCAGLKKLYYEINGVDYTQVCVNCAGTGEVSYEDYVKITGVD